MSLLLVLALLLGLFFELSNFRQNSTFTILTESVYIGSEVHRDPVTNDVVQYSSVLLKYSYYFYVDNAASHLYTGCQITP